MADEKMKVGGHPAAGWIAWAKAGARHCPLPPSYITSRFLPARLAS